MVCVNGPDEIDYRYLFSNVYYCNTFTTRSAIDCRWEQPSPALIIVSIDFFLTLFSYQQNNSKELHPSLITLYCISIFILLVFGTLNKTTKFCKHTFTKKQSRSIVSSLSTAYHQSCIEKQTQKPRKSSSRELFPVFRRYALPGCVPNNNALLLLIIASSPT